MTFHLPKGNYNFLPLITDINSKDELKPKKKENFTFTDKYRNLLPPIVVNSKKGKCNNEEISVLTNYEGFIPFTNNDYDIIIPSADTSLNNLKAIDRKSTRLNSSHANISYAVFCLKKK